MKAWTTCVADLSYSLSRSSEVKLILGGQRPLLQRFSILSQSAKAFQTRSFYLLTLVRASQCPGQEEE